MSGSVPRAAQFPERPGSPRFITVDRIPLREYSEEVKQIFEILKREGVPYFLSSFSALDRYLQTNANPYAYIFTEATLAELAAIIPDIEYPGLDSVDAAVFSESGAVFFTTADSESAFPRGSFTVQSMLYEPGRGIYRDPYAVYHDLRKQDLVPENDFTGGRRTVHNAAILVSRYHYIQPDSILSPERPAGLGEEEEQKTLLSSILTAKSPWKGLSLLMEEGYLQEHWPELFRLDAVNHNKEYHPEGNVWQHTLETFKYRKTQELVLSLALFLHDIGKPAAREFEGKPFDGHAEIGADIAGHFLRRLGYPRNDRRTGFLPDKVSHDSRRAHETAGQPCRTPHGLAAVSDAPRAVPLRSLFHFGDRAILQCLQCL